MLVERRLSLLVVVVAVLAAGCAGKPPSSEKVDTSNVNVDASADGEATSGSLGAIRGFVFANDFSPLAGAKVTLLRENVSALTSVVGAFSFDRLASGAYLIAAEKAGWHAKTARAAVRNGTVIELNFTLEPVAVRIPSHQTVELKGMLSCEGLVVAPDGTHDVDCGEADPNLKREWPLAFEGEGLSAIVIEEVWTPTSPLANRLNVTLATRGFGSSDLVLAAGIAESGYAKFVVSGPVLAKYYPEGGEARVFTHIEPARAAPGAPVDAGLATQQPVTVYASWFYWSTPEPGFAVGKGA